MHNTEKIFCRTAVFFAARDSDEFKRQSQAFATRLEAAERLDQSVSFDANHYDIIDMLVSSETPLSRSIHQTITRL